MLNTIDRFRAVRQHTEMLCKPLSAEDCVVQSMPDASPIRWHLAHTTWFFETFVLCAASNDTVFDPHYHQLFNSYYNSVGTPYPRSQRGILSRPTVDEVWQYRRSIDRAMETLLDESFVDPELIQLLTVGLHHEQQHQELMLTDLKHAFSCNPIHPVYRDSDRSKSPLSTSRSPPTPWIEFETESIVEIGADGDNFCFDNELPRHRELILPYAIACNLVTCGEYLEFVEAGGYRDPSHWLSAGWSTVQAQNWVAPLYWTKQQAGWDHFTLHGSQRVDLSAPVTHLSYYEADAYARFRGLRLPTEFEWEHAVEADAGDQAIQSDAMREDAMQFHPQHLSYPGCRMQSTFGSVWQWTSSDYAPYHGYRIPAGSIGEYNGKFMSGNYVLRGSSCVTPPRHSRVSYRNFFAPSTRWQFTGLRLARDL